MTRWGTIKADFRTHATSLEGVYAVGDIVRGASLVVWAIRDGREAADAILEYLSEGGVGGRGIGPNGPCGNHVAWHAQFHAHELRDHPEDTGQHELTRTS